MCFLKAVDTYSYVPNRREFGISRNELGIVENLISGTVLISGDLE